MNLSVTKNTVILSNDVDTRIATVSMETFRVTLVENRETVFVDARCRTACAALDLAARLVTE